MAQLNSVVLQALAALTGVATRLGYFNRGEHHMYAVQYVQAFLGVIFTAVGVLVGAAGKGVQEALFIIGPPIGLYLAGLYGSLIVYRLFFHPLRHIPGPTSTKISNLCFSARLGRGDGHNKMLDMHRRYGAFVRLGSSDVSTTHPKAMNAIYGRGSKCTKAGWYDLTLPLVSMQTTRRRAEHDKRRRVWGAAFNDKLLGQYEERIKIFQDQLTSRISTAKGESINAANLFNEFSFDVMGDLAFGTTFNMLKDNKTHSAIKLLHKGMEPLAFQFPIWLFRLLLAIPGAMNDWLAFKDYCCEVLDDRMKRKVETPNISAFLLEPWQDKAPTGYDLNMLQGDCQLIIVAGSDTTSATLAGIFYELAKWPEMCEQLRRDLRSLIESGSGISNQSLQSLDLFNGVISETLRLHPSAGTQLQRETPPEGLMIGDTFIPPETTIWCPHWVVARNEDVYAKADSFIPERWFSKPELIKEPSAYAPFSLGTYNCIGKNLGLMTLRTTVAKILLEFDFHLTAGIQDRSFEDKMRMQFTTWPGPLNLTFRKRKRIDE